MDKKMKRKEKMENASKNFWTGLAGLFLLPIFVSERGWKEGTGKRFGYFLFVVAIFAALMFFTSIFKDKFLFQLFLVIVSSIFTYHHCKGKSRKKKIWFFFLWLMYLIGVFYLDYFIDKFITAMLAVIGVAFLIFLIEERTWKNIYPKYAIYIAIAVIIFYICAGIGGLFQKHEYYADKQTISVADLRAEKKSVIKLKDSVWSREIPHGAKRKLPDDIAGREKVSTPVKDWASAFSRNHQPAEFDRIKTVADNFFMAIYIATALLFFSLVATQELLVDSIKKFASRGKGKKEGKEGGISYAQTFFMDRIWDFLKEFLNIWKKKK